MYIGGLECTIVEFRPKKTATLLVAVVQVNFAPFRIHSLSLCCMLLYPKPVPASTLYGYNHRTRCERVWLSSEHHWVTRPFIRGRQKGIWFDLRVMELTFGVADPCLCFVCFRNGFRRFTISHWIYVWGHTYILATKVTWSGGAPCHDLLITITFTMGFFK